jgi:riboflavin synthase
MFTGIVEETGRIARIDSSPQGIRLAVQSQVCGSDTRPGDSVAVNGCCLTAVQVESATVGGCLHFDLLRETWNRTNLQFGVVGSAVNLERSLRADSRLGGHFVTGHIDAVGTIQKWQQNGADWELEIAAPREILPYLVFKGAIAVDGISLTVAAVLENGLRIWIIPHTLEVTALRERRVGDAVNLEADILAKYVERLVGGFQSRIGQNCGASKD